MNADWVSVPGYEGVYEVNALGQIRSLHWKKTRVLRPRVNPDGYAVVSLCKDGTVERVFLHRVIARTFYPEQTGPIVRHLDGNASNNSAANLAWGTYSENAFDRVKHGNDVGANATHCLRGHEFSAENTLRGKSGSRWCRMCVPIRRRERAERLMSGDSA